jgi:hypothetical protein
MPRQECSVPLVKKVLDNVFGLGRAAKKRVLWAVG